MLNKDNVDSLLNGMGDLVTADTDKAEILDAFFSPVFTNKVSQSSLLSERVHRGKQLAVDENRVRDYLR